LNIESGGILKIAFDSAGPQLDKINCDIVTLTTGALFTLDGYDSCIDSIYDPIVAVTCSASSGEFSNHPFLSTISTGCPLPDATFILLDYNASWTEIKLEWI
jgi:hypothetical protein